MLVKSFSFWLFSSIDNILTLKENPSMGFFKRFFGKIKDSIYNPSFYKSIPQSKLESAFSYFFLLIFVLSIIQTLFLAFPIVKVITQLTNKDLPKAVSQFPEELQVKIKDGKASTNVKEPYFVPLPKGTQTDFKNFIVLDTITPYSEDSFKKYDTFALLTRDSLYYKADKNQPIKSADLKSVKDLTIDRASLTALLNKYSPLAKWITPLLIILVGFLLFLFYILRIFYAIFLGVAILLVSRIIQPSLTFGQSYKVAIYAMTLGLLVEVVLTIISPLIGIRGFPFMVTILSIVVFVVNFKTEKEVVN